jgi:hypothetical protein
LVSWAVPRWPLPRPPPEAVLRSLRFRLAGLLEWLRPDGLPPVLEAPRLPALRLVREVDREVAFPLFMVSLLRWLRCKHHSSGAADVCRRGAPSM